MFKRKRRRSKYNVDNSKLGKAARTVDGILFASNSEAARYAVLKKRQMAGEISGLETQPQFVILPRFTHQGKKYRAVHYTADFRYTENGATVIEEVKGKATRDFTLRMKMFLSQHPELVYKLVPSKEVNDYD